MIEALNHHSTMNVSSNVSVVFWLFARNSHQITFNFIFFEWNSHMHTTTITISSNNFCSLRKPERQKISNEFHPAWVSLFTQKLSHMGLFGYYLRNEKFYTLRIDCVRAWRILLWHCSNAVCCWLNITQFLLFSTLNVFHKLTTFSIFFTTVHSAKYHLDSFFLLLFLASVF